MKTATINNEAILDLYTMKNTMKSSTYETLFGDLKIESDFTMQMSSIEEYKEFYSKIYAQDAVERKIKFTNEDDMIFKIEKIEKYGDEEFLAKKFFKLRKNNENFFFDEFSVSSCIHAGGFIPVMITRTEEDAFEVKLVKDAFGEGKRIAKSDEGRHFISHYNRFNIYTDM